ncbi:DUF5667 domain-containing protein [Nocardioides sp.]|uniref:DUF5667 domain-containing protein n=1 Tax=Nocardioides sp. TaxID=35761 RepID=UPI002C307D32|nr:DUF5667 domain-containing protein [Nocardioides sp.]HSX66244.1 DUF5667 domain-containing protein [Nocardioides sp.]
MSPVSPARRRAEEFASLLDARELASLDGRGGSAGAHTEALEIVAALRAVTAPQPSPAYVAELRSNLLAAADTLLAPAAPRLTLVGQVTTAPQRHRRKLSVAIGTLTVLAGTTGVAMAAQSALPGESLYPIKRILESAQTSLSADDAARADRIMDLAHDRLGETQALAGSDSANSRAQIPSSLEDFVAQASQAADVLLGEYAESGDIATIIELRDFLRDSLDALAGLKGAVPADYAADFDAAVNALLSIDEQTLAACGDCGGLLDIPAILLSGAAIPSAPSAPTAAPRVTPAPSPTSNAVTDLLNQLPKVGSTASALPKAPVTGSATPTPSPSTSSQPKGTLGSILGPEGSVTEPLTDTLDSVLDPLLDPLLGGLL